MKKIIIIFILLCILPSKSYGYTFYPLMSETDFMQNIINTKAREISENISLYSYNIDIFKWLRPNVPLPTEVQKFIYETCKEYSIDYDLILGIIATESNFNVNCIYVNNSPFSVDEGLMQINNQYSSWYAKLANLTKYNTLNPCDSVKMGIAGLAYYRDYWINKGINGANLEIYMLNSYNMGIQGYRNFLLRTNKISRNYDKKVKLNQERIGVH